MSTNLCNICGGPSTKAYLEKNKMCGTCFAKVKKTIAKKTTKSKCPVCNTDTKSTEIDENGICKTCNGVISSIQTETKDEGKPPKTKKVAKKPKVADIIPSEILSDIDINNTPTSQLIDQPVANISEPANLDQPLDIPNIVLENNVIPGESSSNSNIKEKILQLKQLLSELESILQI
jgi:hypothetical protein